MTHVFAILGLIAAIILWHFVQRLAFGPDGATACGKPVGENDCENRWDLVGKRDAARKAAPKPKA